MLENLKSKLNSKPYYQMMVCLFISIFLQLFLVLLKRLGVFGIEDLDIWIMYPTLLFLYIVFNTILGFNQKEISNYYKESIYSFMLYLILGYGVSWILGGQKTFEEKNFGWILIVIIIIYLVFTSILNLIRFIIGIVLKQDEKQRTEEQNNSNLK